MFPSLVVAALLLAPAVLNPARAIADETIRVGLIQMDARLYDRAYNLARAEKLIREAAQMRYSVFTSFTILPSSMRRLAP